MSELYVRIIRIADFIAELLLQFRCLPLTAYIAVYV